ncbi:MAG: tetratricopeptide repeat protein [Pirellulaceae bacterium]|nr:tetratricopeptide repeat protein [Pirellulaceae bacterium]
MNEPSDKSPWILDVTEDTFEQEVTARSQDIPVVVDFWAEWCQPCRSLGPVLEDLAREFNGRFVLAKAETEKNETAAQRFQVSSIPAVFAISGGEVVDFFQGVLPEETIRSWLEQICTQAQFTSIQPLESTNPAEAEEKYRQFLESNPNVTEASIGLARTLLLQEKHDACREIIAELERRGFLEPEAEKVKAQLELQSKQGGDVEACQAAATANPNDLDLQLKLAEAFVGTEAYRECFEICLDLLQRDRHGLGESARELMVDVFRILPDDSDLIAEYRRKLSLALY